MPDLGLAKELAQRLVARQNADGGWPTMAAGGSATEPTGWALRALSSVARTPGVEGPLDSVQRARGSAADWLIDRQNPDGSWPVSDQVTERGASSAVAALALMAADGSEPADRAVAGARWLLGHPGKRVAWRTRAWLRLNPERNPLEVDLRLRGWPWQAGMWGWVEPTSMALLLLRDLGDRLDHDSVAAAVADGEALLLDRVCPGGGWNHGLGRSHDEDLWPYPDTTAFALLALGPGRPEPSVAEGLAALELMLRQPVSRLATALGILVLDSFARDATTLRELLARQWAAEFPQPTTRAMAISILAVTGDPPARRTAGSARRAGESDG